jgi:hypothetical protein
MSLPEKFDIRRGVESDAVAIATLFQNAYEQSSHECKDPLYVLRTLQGDDHIWLVVDGATGLRAVTCVRRIAWNRSYETCYSITVPAERGRGLAKVLFLESLVHAQQRDDCDLIVGYPRNRTMYQLTTSGFERPPVAVGYDGGLNIANGVREYHLITIARNERTRPARVVSRASLPIELEGIRKSVLSSLSFDATLGNYPSTRLVGPRGNGTVHVLGCDVSYRRERGAVNGAVHLTNVQVVEDGADPDAAILRFIGQLGAVPYVGMQVLADKTHLLEQLFELGFEITAYLPAWHAAGGKRYDCLMLVGGIFDRRPTTHGVHDIVDSFRSAFAPIARNAFERRLHA